ncbi:MAG: beta-galactosidase [Candidatus Dormibacteria bacterium]
MSGSRARRLALLGGALALPPVLEVRLRRPQRQPSAAWRRVAVRKRGPCRLGISYRPRQAEALGLDPGQVLRRLAQLPVELVRLGAYWSRIEKVPGDFDLGELDRSLDVVESAGKKVILAVGALKTFGYPELYVPPHWAPSGFPEGRLVTPASHPRLNAAAREFLARVVSRYRERRSVLAWQVENEALDPLGMEHSWRLSRDFLASEMATVRSLDPTRPILLNGFLPMSLTVRAAQLWRTRGQGDSLEAALSLADMVGLDIYPRNAAAALGGHSLYLDGAQLPWNRVPWSRLRRRVEATGRELVVSEGQAEPWEATTVPPDLPGSVAFSCPPERVIANYNLGLGPSGQPPVVSAYFFWGLEYWLRRETSGDPSYFAAFTRILEES